MGCRCCRMVKSYIDDPAVPHNVKQDPSNSLVPSYQTHRLSKDGIEEKQGFQNYGYISNSPTKFDIDNNHINQARSNLPQPTGSDSSLYILEPDGRGSPIKTSAVLPSAPPLSSESMLGTESKFRDSGLGNGGGMDLNEGLDQSAEYVGDTADEESVISVDIHTSSTSLSSADTKLVIEDLNEDDTSSSQRKDKDSEDRVSVTDSMVAEALAALEEATAGEEYD